MSEVEEALARAAAGERVVLRAPGGEELAIISLEDLQYLQEIEAEEDRIDHEVCMRFKADLAAGRAELVPWEEVKRNLGL